MGSWSQIIKLCVNLKSAIHRCSAVDPKVIMGEPSASVELSCGRLYGCFVAVFNPFVCGMLKQQNSST